MKAIGIDFGSKNIGIAITYHGSSAMPYSVIPARPLSQAIALIEQIIQENDIESVVVGIPYSLSGEMSAQTKSALHFEKMLKKRLAVKIEQVDERLTTRQAENMLLQYGQKKAREKKDIDKYSAALILDSYLEAKKADL